MLLVVDVGNTQTHFGAFRGGELVEHWRFATVRTSTSDELGAKLTNLLALRDLSFDDLAASIVSSPVPQHADEWRLMSDRYLDHETVIVRQGIKT
ncbi:MAG: type III pantothenate kinase, partial [Solirubrobacteraceae bacterium]